MSLDVGDKLAGYEILELLGEGGMGAVYRARQLSLGREVALKVMLEEGMPGTEGRRFDREARIHVTLAHPCIVRVLDSGSEDGRAFLVMELVRGQVLEDVIANEAPMAFPQVARIGRDIVNALAYMQGRGIVHRDLKPRNVFLTQERRAKVGDFGLAWTDSVTMLTKEGTVLGTVKYLAPESLSDPTVGPSADRYALGVILFRMITGSMPYQGEDTRDWLVQILKTVPERVKTLRKDTPDALDELVAGLLAKDPAKRPTAGEARAALGMLLPPGEVSSENEVDRAALIAQVASPAPEPATPAPTARPRATGNVRPVRTTGRKPVISTAAPVPASAARGLPLPPRRAAVAGAASCAIAFVLMRIQLAPPAVVPPLPPPSVSVPAAAPSPLAAPELAQSLLDDLARRTPPASPPLTVYGSDRGDASTRPWRDIHAATLGKPLAAGRAAAAFLVTEPERLEEAAVTGAPSPPVAFNGVRVDGAALPRLAVRAGWNVIEWEAPPAAMAPARLALKWGPARTPAPARVPELPDLYAERLREYWKSIGGGLSVLEAVKIARGIQKERPTDEVPVRLIGTSLVVIARHRRELEKDRASDTFLAPAGVLATDSRETGEFASDGTGWLLAAIDQEPRDALAWAYAAVGLMALGQAERADQALEHACRIGPSLYETWYQHYELYELARVDGRKDLARLDRTIAALRVADFLAAQGVSETYRRQSAGALRQCVAERVRAR